jgi:hypothetical protein
VKPARFKRPVRPIPPLPWTAAAAALSQLLEQKGSAMTAKLTLVGRPGKIIDKGDVILTTVTVAAIPPLPKGLPEAPADPTVYLVFIARKQWRKVAAALDADPADRLIPEGYPVHEKKLGVIALLTQMVTTTGLQAAKRQAVVSD